MNDIIYFYHLCIFYDKVAVPCTYANRGFPVN